MSMRIGAHVDNADPLTEAAARGADVVQVFLTDPKKWDIPPTREDAAGLAASDVDIYVHAPYVINIATPNNRVRFPSRNLLRSCANGAAAVCAKGVIVHGGHVTQGYDVSIGIDNWRKTFERAADDGGFAVPVLIENTAGGDRACARRFETLARLWDAIGEYEVGFCLDTCHAFCGGEELLHIVDRVKAITGRIDLVHANNAKDGFDSGRDRHDNLLTGTIDADLIAAVVMESGAPVVVETPGGASSQASDIAYLRQRLA